MKQIEEIPLSAIPESVLESVLHSVANFTIGFVRVGVGPDRRDVELIGTGTLVMIGGARAILTAQHVLEVIPTAGPVGLVLDPARQTPTIDANSLQPVLAVRGSNDEEGPDIAVLTLAEPVASTIGAKKSFFNLELRRDTMLNNPRAISDGFWVVQGFIGERTVVERRSDGSISAKGFFCFSGSGGPESVRTSGGFDYVDFPVTPPDLPNVPSDFRGISGGGLWQIPLRKNSNGAIEHEAPLLSGVVYYQFSEGSKRHLKCHFRQSVYGPVCNSLWSSRQEYRSDHHRSND